MERGGSFKFIQKQICRTNSDIVSVNKILFTLKQNLGSSGIGDFANLYNLGYVCCMVRQARLDAPGVLHHVMARGIERRPIFIDDRDVTEMSLFTVYQILLRKGN